MNYPSYECIEKNIVYVGLVLYTVSGIHCRSGYTSLLNKGGNHCIWHSDGSPNLSYEIPSQLSKPSWPGKDIDTSNSKPLKNESGVNS